MSALDGCVTGEGLLRAYRTSFGIAVILTVISIGWLVLNTESEAIKTCKEPCYLLSCTYAEGTRMPRHILARWNSSEQTYEAFHDFCMTNEGYFTCATWTACTCHLDVLEAMHKGACP